VSYELSAILELATAFNDQTVSLSRDSLAVICYCQYFLENRKNWIDQRNPFDTVTNEDWDTIEALVAGLYRELFSPMLGHILSFATTNLPSNVLPCDGTQYLRTDYPFLYEVLDAAFIVDADHFITPDLRGRTIIGTGPGIALTERFVNDVGGQEFVTLTIGELAVHSHTSVSHSHSDTGHTHTEIASSPVVVFEGEVPIPGGAAVAVPSVTGVGFAALTSEEVTIENAGSDESHVNMPPYVALNYGMIAR
jgi:microcystin-dependent protein